MRRKESTRRGVVPYRDRVRRATVRIGSGRRKTRKTRMNARVFERMDFQKKSQIFDDDADDDDDDDDAPQKARAEKEEKEKEKDR